MRNIKYLFNVLTEPRCWIRLGRTNNAWDELINKALDNPKFERYSEYTVFLNGINLWIGNFPYAFGSHNGDDSFGLPSRRTVFRLRDEYTKSFIKEITNE